MKNKVKYIGTAPKFNIRHRRDNGFFKSVIALTLKGNPLVTTKHYTTATTNFVCVWVYDLKNRNPSGSYRATGYGYDRDREATEGAIRNAGYVFDRKGAGVEDMVRILAESIHKGKVLVITTGA